jgi:hypothetical protein
VLRSALSIVEGGRSAARAELGAGDLKRGRRNDRTDSFVCKRWFTDRYGAHAIRSPSISK